MKDCPDGTPSAGTEPAWSKDEEHLKLLSIFHYLVSALTGLFALFPILHLIVGLLFIFAPGTFTTKGEPPPPMAGWIFVIFGAGFIAIGWILAGLVFAAGRFLASRRHYTFCLVMGAIECMLIPFGTVLGVFTIIVLMRESVKPVFNANTAQLLPEERT